MHLDNKKYRDKVVAQYFSKETSPEVKIDGVVPSSPIRRFNGVSDEFLSIDAQLVNASCLVLNGVDQKIQFDYQPTNIKINGTDVTVSWTITDIGGGNWTIEPSTSTYVYDLLINDTYIYPCSEGNGTTIYDVIGNDRHGTIVNAVLPDIWGTQDVYHYNFLNGYWRYNDGSSDLHCPIDAGATIQTTFSRQEEVKGYSQTRKYNKASDIQFANDTKFLSEVRNLVLGDSNRDLVRNANNGVYEENDSILVVSEPIDIFEEDRDGFLRKSPKPPFQTDLSVAYSANYTADDYTTINDLLGNYNLAQVTNLLNFNANGIREGVPLLEFNRNGQQHYAVDVADYHGLSAITMYMIYQRRQVNGTNLVYILNQPNLVLGGGNGFGFKDTQQVGEGVRFEATTGAGLAEAGDNTLVDGETDIYVGVYDGSNILLYKNGNLCQSVAQTGTLLSTDEQLIINGFSTSFTSQFSGDIALGDFGIYTRALNATEVSELTDFLKQRYNL